MALRFDLKNAETDVVFTHKKKFPAWAWFSLAANGLLILAVLWLLRARSLDSASEVDPRVEMSLPDISTNLVSKTQPLPLKLGPRHQLNYRQWVALLRREARVVAAQKPKNLYILAGDSLSLWFPPDLLLNDRNWLNQGISGETSAGLYKRLRLFDRTNPEVIFVMIGINDLIREERDATILENYRDIIQRLRRVHPKSQVVVQSILPHGGEKSTWQGRDRLLEISNSRIEKLNRRLQAIALEENVYYLDLYSLFIDDKGNLRPDLTTDGLHLSQEGYLVWRSAIAMYTQLRLKNPSIDTRSLPSSTKSASENN